MYSKTDIDRIPYNKQRNYCVWLVRREKKTYFSDLNKHDVTTMKPLRKK